MDTGMPFNWNTLPTYSAQFRRSLGQVGKPCCASVPQRNGVEENYFVADGGTELLINAELRPVLHRVMIPVSDISLPAVRYPILAPLSESRRPSVRRPVSAALWLDVARWSTRR